MNAVMKGRSTPQLAATISPDEGSLKAYFKEVRTFEQDRTRSLKRSTRLAWTVALVASAVAATACLAVAGLTPLKTVVCSATTWVKAGGDQDARRDRVAGRMIVAAEVQCNA